MAERIQPLSTFIWWLQPIGLLIAAGLITAGLFHAYRAVWLWRLRNTLVSDPVIAKAIEGVKPPPNALYAAILLALGAGTTGAMLMLR